MRPRHPTLYRPEPARQDRRAVLCANGSGGTGSGSRSALRSAVAIAAGALVGLAAFACGAGPAAADYPERPVKLVVAFPAGSGADLLVRFFSEKMAAGSGATIVVDNKPGANGNIGTQAVAQARPDGYTVLMGASPNMAGNPLIYKDLPWDARRDFEPVTTFAQLGFVLTVATASPARSVADLTAYLKAKGDKATFAFGNTTGLAAGSLYAAEAGLALTSVGYKSGPQALSDVAAGQVDFMFTDAIFATGQEKQGVIRLIAVTTPKRIKMLPQLPTMVEEGLGGATIAPWWGAYVPARTPADIKVKLAGWLDAVVSAPGTGEALAKLGIEPLPGDAALATAMLEQSIKDWERIVGIAKIVP